MTASYDAQSDLRGLAKEHLSRPDRYRLSGCVDRAASVLLPGEVAVSLTDAVSDDEFGLAVVTDQRLLFIRVEQDEDVAWAMALEVRPTCSVEDVPGPAGIDLADVIIRSGEVTSRLESVGERSWAEELAAVISGDDATALDLQRLECPSCGADLGHSSYCGNCGIGIDQEYSGKPPPPTALSDLGDEPWEQPIPTRPRSAPASRDSFTVGRGLAAGASAILMLVVGVFLRSHFAPYDDACTLYSAQKRTFGSLANAVGGPNSIPKGPSGCAFNSFAVQFGTALTWIGVVGIVLVGIVLLIAMFVPDAFGDSNKPAE